MQPDATDWKIIDILRNRHESNNTIAKKLNVSEGTIRQRIKKLKDAKILTIRALINPDVLENQQLALIAVNLQDPLLLEQRAQQISELNEVLSVSVASGRYDLLIEVLVNSNKGLVKFLTEKLSHVEGISSAESFLMLKNYNRFV